MMTALFDCVQIAFFRVLKISVLIPFLIIQTNLLYSQPFSEWQWQHPLPTGNTLNSIDFINDNTGFAAGTMGSIVKTVDKGITWNSLYSGTAKTIFKIKFLNTETGICAGKDGLILRTTDGGIVWTQIFSQTNLDLNDICITENKIFVCGLGGIVLMSPDKGFNWSEINSKFIFPLFCINFLNADTGVCGGYNNIIRTTNAGLNWEILKANIIPSTQISKIKYVSDNNIFAVGNSPFGDFYFSKNGGDTWDSKSLELPFLFNGSADLVRSMDFIDSIHGSIVTDLGTLLTTSTGGKYWTRDTSQRSYFLKEGIYKDVLIRDNFNITVCGNGGRVMNFSGSENIWTTLTGDNKNIHDSFRTDNETIFCSGDHGTLFRKKNNDEGWEKLFIKGNHRLKSIYFVSDLIGFVCSESGNIFKTSDGGDTWIEILNFFKMNKSFQTNKIFFVDKYTGFIAGGNENESIGKILKTTDSGKNWKLVYNNFGEGLLRDIHFKNSDNGVAVGNNGILAVTSDGGSNWNSQSLIPYDLYSIDFTKNLIGVIVGENGTVFRSSNKGANWNFITPVQYKDLNSVKFLDNDIVVAFGNGGTTIHSTDGGYSWNVLNSITDNDLYSVNSDNTGIYGFGENGTIIYSGFSFRNNMFSAGENKAQGNYHSILTNFPNPFNITTNINYELEISNHVSIKVFDILGNEIGNFVNEIQNRGSYKIQFYGRGLSSGIYFYTIFLNGIRYETKRMILLK